MNSNINICKQSISKQIPTNKIERQEKFLWRLMPSLFNYLGGMYRKNGHSIKMILLLPCTKKYSLRQDRILENTLGFIYVWFSLFYVKITFYKFYHSFKISSTVYETMKTIFLKVWCVKEEIRNSHRKETKIDICIILKVPAKISWKKIMDMEKLILYLILVLLYLIFE